MLGLARSKIEEGGGEGGCAAAGVAQEGAEEKDDGSSGVCDEATEVRGSYFWREMRWNE